MRYRVTLSGGKFLADGDDVGEARANAVQTIVESADVLALTPINPDDPIERYGEDVDQQNALHAMRAITKALLVRLGGDLELSSTELEEASLVNVYFDGTKDPAVLRIVEGDPPEIPRYAEQDE